MIIAKNRETGEIRAFRNVKSVLREINRDRSASWQKYNEHDWKEGLNEMTEYRLLEVRRGKPKKVK